MVLTETLTMTSSINRDYVRSPAFRRNRMAENRINAELRTPGFTLIEMAAVMVLLAIFATVVGISLRGHLEKIRFDAALDSIELFDRRARHEASENSQFVALQIDTIAGRVEQKAEVNSERSARRLTLSRGMRIDRVRTMDGERRRGTTNLAVTPRGQSESYALRLRTASGRQMWLLVCGLSGQAVRVESDDDLESLLAAPTATRRNAG
jgi:prepilin-type N-terminal cleavage/methylation domain-containing protein